MRKGTLRFALIDDEDNLVMEGTVAQCAKALGVSDKQFRRVIETTRNIKYKGVQIVDVTNESLSDEFDLGQFRYADAIANWDAFVTPIRERYGIPVYKKKEGRYG